MWGGVVFLNLPSPLIAVFKYICYRHSPHTDISNVGGLLACGLLYESRNKGNDWDLIQSNPTSLP